MGVVKSFCPDCNKEIETTEEICVDFSSTISNVSYDVFFHINFMKKAYGMLYKLENLTRLIINQTMTKEYGIDWIIQAPLTKKHQSYKKDFTRFYLHELVSMITSYECLTILFTSTEVRQVQSTFPIRNKIAHSKLITKNEFEQLSGALKVFKNLYLKMENEIMWNFISREN